MVTRAIRPSPLSQCGRVLAILQDGNPHAMRDIHRQVGFCRLNSRVAELRDRLRPEGRTIVCWRFEGDYYYRLVTAADLASLAEPETPSHEDPPQRSGSTGDTAKVAAPEFRASFYEKASAEGNEAELGAAQLALEIPRSAYEARA